MARLESRNSFHNKVLPHLFTGAWEEPLSGWFVDRMTSVSAILTLIAFAFATLVGVILDVWPSRRAAGLDPIQALRCE